jgi:hypothetical protein
MSRPIVLLAGLFVFFMLRNANAQDLNTAIQLTRSESYDKAEAMESAILTTVDSIKSHMKGVDITVANFEKKGDEVALPVTLTGQIRDYTVFINNINYLQSLTLPLYYIDSLSITDQSDEKKAVIKFDIQGTLKMQSVNMGSGS